MTYIFKLLTQVMIACILIAFSGSIALAGVTIAGTRIIFPGGEREQSIRTTNKGNEPALVQVWIDDGSANNDINQVKIPFTATPPVFRVEPHKGQSIRLIYNGMNLPQDRESVYWFNLLEIPPVDPANKNKDRLELAFRTRIKIFYRPSVLKSSSSQLLQQLRWQLVSKEKSQAIRVENPTPYYFSFDSASVISGANHYPLDVDMVAPFTSKTFVLAQKKPFPASLSGVNFRLINDYGAAVERRLKYSPGNKLILQN